MNKREIRLELLKCKRDLRALREIKAKGLKEEKRKYRDISYLKNKIKHLREELHEENNNNNIWIDRAY